MKDENKQRVSYLNESSPIVNGTAPENITKAHVPHKKLYDEGPIIKY